MAKSPLLAEQQMHEVFILGSFVLSGSPESRFKQDVMRGAIDGMTVFVAMSDYRSLSAGSDPSSDRRTNIRDLAHREGAKRVQKGAEILLKKVNRIKSNAVYASYIRVLKNYPNDGVNGYVQGMIKAHDIRMETVLINGLETQIPRAPIDYLNSRETTVARTLDELRQKVTDIALNPSILALRSRRNLIQIRDMTNQVESLLVFSSVEKDERGQYVYRDKSSLLDMVQRHEELNRILSAGGKTEGVFEITPEARLHAGKHLREDPRYLSLINNYFTDRSGAMDTAQAARSHYRECVLSFNCKDQNNGSPYIFPSEVSPLYLHDASALGDNMSDERRLKIYAPQPLKHKTEIAPVARDIAPLDQGMQKNSNPSAEDELESNKQHFLPEASDATKASVERVFSQGAPLSEEPFVASGGNIDETDGGSSTAPLPEASKETMRAVELVSNEKGVGEDKDMGLLERRMLILARSRGLLAPKHVNYGAIDKTSAIETLLDEVEASDPELRHEVIGLLSEADLLEEGQLEAVESKALHLLESAASVQEKTKNLSLV